MQVPQVTKKEVARLSSDERQKHIYLLKLQSIFFGARIRTRPPLRVERPSRDCLVEAVPDEHNPNTSYQEKKTIKKQGKYFN